MRSGWRRFIAAVALPLALTLSLGLAPTDNAEAAGPFSLRTLSTPADRVSGGDVLVELRVPSPQVPFTVTLNGRDVTSAFQPGQRRQVLVGLVTGLDLGTSTLTVEGRGGEPRSSLEITNYPITGPIVSGPHVQPFICQTESFQLPDGTTLGPPLDEDCTVETRVQYVYQSTEGGPLQPLPSTDTLPADVAMTTTTAGVTVPFVVRVETGSMNRGIYQNSILHDPTSEPPPSPFSPPAGWNRRLIALHGSGCTGGWYVQGAAMGGNILDPERLGEGYAFFINTLNHPSNSCNPFLAGETTMMGKEHFVETYGVPEFTVSTGGSGGAYTSLQVADAFPGLFDGVLISATFPGALSIARAGLHERLVARYFRAADPAGFTDEQILAVTGYEGIQAFLDMANQSARTDPVPGREDLPGYASARWNDAVPEALRYHPTDNPDGARPTIFDWARNIYGVDPVTGFARRPFDNVGVQYGLNALNAGAISVEQFLDLNEGIGGYDQDANYLPERSVGDAGAIRRAYQSSVALGGGGGLAEIPVFDISLLYDEDEIYHYQWFHFAVRERMRSENGHADNHVMWRGGLDIDELLGEPTPEGAALQEAVDTESWAAFIEWVEAVAADHSNAPERVKVVRNRPDDLVNGCWTKELTPQFIAEPQTLSRDADTECNRLWPSFTSSLQEAGGPVASNILKCQLKPVDMADYEVPFTPAEESRLRGVFPDGVCDWSKPGVNQVPVVPWASFGPSPDNLVFDVAASTG